MLAQKQSIKSLGRLKKRSDFLLAQRAGRKWVAKGLLIELRDNENLGLRYGLTVSRKVSKLAVTRNRLKRQLKSIACEVLPNYAGHNLDIVIVGRIQGLERDYSDLEKDLIWCLEKMSIEEKKLDA